jgi:hypothetical protein
MTVKSRRIGPDTDRQYHGARLVHNSEVTALAWGDIVQARQIQTAVPEVERCNVYPHGDILVVNDQGGIAADEEGTVAEWVIYTLLDTSGATRGDPVYWDGVSLNLDCGTPVGIVLSAAVNQCLIHPAKYQAELTDPTKWFVVFDDFVYQNTVTEVCTPWVLNKGTDGAAADPTPPATQLPGGVIACVSGAGDGSVAQDGSQFVAEVPIAPSKGGLFCECALYLGTAITNKSVNFGLTDDQGLEEPFTVGALDAVTSVATDAACLTYDEAAVTKEWFALAVDSNVDDAGNAATGEAPVANTYQILRIDVSEDGSVVKYYVDGDLVHTATTGIDPTKGYFVTVSTCSDGSAAQTVIVDAVRFGHLRHAW